MAKKNSKDKGWFEPVQTLKGMHDILPQDSALWDFFSDKIRKFATAYGFGRIETPVLEEARLISRGVGEGTDIVDKEMYVFEDRGEERVCLRPEYTASLARSYIQQGMLNLPQPVKLYSIGPVFRHDNPQAGRFRQFYQFEFDAFGDRHPVVDAQLIILACKFFSELAVPVTVSINSIGDANCRPQYLANLVEYLKTKKSSLCDVSKERVAKNPFRVLDCKEEKCQSAIGEAPQIVDWLCTECREHFVKVLEFLDELEVPYVLNSRLVRGLDYYTRTTFEFVSADSDIDPLALGGGGRFDGLVEMLGGRPTPAVGFACGVERILAKVKARGDVLVPSSAPSVFIAQIGSESRKAALRMFDELRRAGIAIAENFSKDGLGPQLETAGRLKVRFTLILGQKELLDRTVIIRDMESGVQEIVDAAKVVGEMKKRIEKSNQQVYSINGKQNLEGTSQDEIKPQNSLF